MNEVVYRMEFFNESYGENKDLSFEYDQWLMLDHVLIVNQNTCIDHICTQLQYLSLPSHLEC